MVTFCKEYTASLDLGPKLNKTKLLNLITQFD